MAATLNKTGRRILRTNNKAGLGTTEVGVVKGVVVGLVTVVTTEPGQEALATLMVGTIVNYLGTIIRQNRTTVTISRWSPLLPGSMAVHSALRLCPATGRTSRVVTANHLTLTHIQAPPNPVIFRCPHPRQWVGVRGGVGQCPPRHLLVQALPDSIHSPLPWTRPQ